MVLAGELGDEFAIHVRRSREAVEEDHGGIGGRAGLAVEDVEIVNFSDLVGGCCGACGQDQSNKK